MDVDEATLQSPDNNCLEREESHNIMQLKILMVNSSFIVYHLPETSPFYQCPTPMNYGSYYRISDIVILLKGPGHQ